MTTPSLCLPLVSRRRPYEAGGNLICLFQGLGVTAPRGLSEPVSATDLHTPSKARIDHVAHRYPSNRAPGSGSLHTMRDAIMEIREEDYTRSARPDFGMEHVLASYVRRQGWSIKEIMLRFRLTDGQARGVMYAAASRSTLNHVIKIGGWPIGLMLIAGVIGHTIYEHIEQGRENARKQFERMDQGLRKMADDLPAVLGLDHPGQH